MSPARARLPPRSMAVADFIKDHPNVKVEVISGDHQNKADVGTNIANQWFDVDKVDLIIDVPNSGVALAISQVAAQKNKVFVGSGPASSDLTGPNATPTPCTGPTTPGCWPTAPARPSSRPAATPGSSSPPTMLSAMRSSATPRRWSRRTAARCSARSVIRSTPAISRRSCCRRRRPRPRSSGSPTPAATPSTPSSRRPSSASSRAGRSLAGLLVFASDINALGLPTAQGLMFTETWYWDPTTPIAPGPSAGTQSAMPPASCRP